MPEKLPEYRLVSTRGPTNAVDAFDAIDAIDALHDLSKEIEQLQAQNQGLLEYVQQLETWLARETEKNKRPVTEADLPQEIQERLASQVNPTDVLALIAQYNLTEREIYMAMHNLYASALSRLRIVQNSDSRAGIELQKLTRIIEDEYEFLSEDIKKQIQERAANTQSILDAIQSAEKKNST